jgi:hypothetical protein
MMKTHTVDRITTMLSVLALATAGCASPYHRGDAILDQETMAIEAKIRPTDGVDTMAARNTVKLAGDASMKGGAAAGAALSLTCGMAVWLCLPLYATTGAFIAGTTGNAAGAVSEVFDLFPPEIAERIEVVLVDIQDRRDFFAEMRHGVADSVPQDRQADTAAADVNVYVGPERIELFQEERDMLALRMTASLFVEWRQTEGEPRNETRQYQYATAEMPVDFWLSDDGAPFDSALTECVEKIVQMMYWDLAPPSR